MVLLRVRYVHIIRPLNIAICNELKFVVIIYFIDAKMVMKVVMKGNHRANFVSFCL